MARRRKRKGHRHTKRERHVYRVLRRKLPHYTEGHVWAMVMGMSPKTLHKAAFKTTSRQYSITHRRAAAARKLKAARKRLRRR